MFSVYNLFYIHSFQPSTGHYTQMVWAETSKIGCGSISWTEGRFIKQFLVCNYGPAGNTLRRPMYEIGKACSRCPSGTSCSNGLCSAQGSTAPLFPPPPQNQPSFSVNIAPTRRPVSIPSRRPSSQILSQAPSVQFGFVPMTDSLQDPRPVQRPTFASDLDQFSAPVNNDISVQNLLQPVQASLPNPPPPSVLLQNSPILVPRPSPTRPRRPPTSQRRPRNCNGMFAFMCRLLSG